MKAIIKWMDHKDGGRSKPPEWYCYPYYSTPVHFTDRLADEESSGITWSLVVEYMSSSENDNEWIADIYYSVDNAPHDNLLPGREFELHEGPRCVAYGKILDT